jgi:hypothetical protein
MKLLEPTFVAFFVRACTNRAMAIKGTRREDALLEDNSPLP